MTGRNIILLAIDDDPANLELITGALEQEGLEILTATDPLEGLEIMRQRRPNILLTDVAMPGITGMEVLARAMEFDPGIDVVIMTAHYSTDSAVEAIRNGACDYFPKPLSLKVVRERVAKMIDAARERETASELERASVSTYQFHQIVGRSPLMLDLFARIRRVAPHYRAALVVGPTGTGKELIAHALHTANPRASGSFVVCNCAALVDTLFESELFGYVRGAFTGAQQDKIGLFEYASKGTLFLDEIGEMPLGAQVNCCVCCRITRCGGSVPRRRATWMFPSWLPPTAICGRWWRPRNFAKTFTIAWPWWSFPCRVSAGAGKICPC
jgi:DNA-binding NtrC family response regulator